MYPANKFCLTKWSSSCTPHIQLEMGRVGVAAGAVSLLLLLLLLQSGVDVRESGGDRAPLVRPLLPAEAAAAAESAAAAAAAAGSSGAGAVPPPPPPPLDWASTADVVLVNGTCYDEATLAGVWAALGRLRPGAVAIVTSHRLPPGPGPGVLFEGGGRGGLEGVVVPASWGGVTARLVRRKRLPRWLASVRT
jgi:hypothetical protein